MGREGASGRCKPLGGETRPPVWSTTCWWETSAAVNTMCRCRVGSGGAPKPSWGTGGGSITPGWAWGWVSEHPKPWEPGLAAEGLCSSRSRLYFSCLDLSRLSSLRPACTRAACGVSPFPERQILSAPSLRRGKMHQMPGGTRSCLCEPPAPAVRKRASCRC